MLLYSLAALGGALLPNDGTTRAAGATEVRLLSGPIHTDLLLPLTAETRVAFAFAERAGVPLHAASAEWLLVGWGSRAFYTATGGYQDLRLNTVWRAATGDSSVLRIDVLGNTDAHKLPSLALEGATYLAFLDAVLEDLADPRPIPDAGLSHSDRFFPAKGRFHLFRTCNTWIDTVFQRVGLRFGRWTPLPAAVHLSLWRFQG